MGGPCYLLRFSIEIESWMKSVNLPHKTTASKRVGEDSHPAGWFLHYLPAALTVFNSQLTNLHLLWPTPWKNLSGWSAVVSKCFLTLFQGGSPPNQRAIHTWTQATGILHHCQRARALLDAPLVWNDILATEKDLELSRLTCCHICS